VSERVEQPCDSWWNPKARPGWDLRSSAYSDLKVANRTSSDSGGSSLTRFRDGRPIPLNKIVARTEGYTYDTSVWALSKFKGFSVAPCRTLTLLLRVLAHAPLTLAPAGSDSQEAYRELLLMMRTMFQKCRLVHADLSEYNILYHEGHLVIIDVSQSVDLDHPHCLVFLREDCTHVTDFFRARQVAVR
jgi:hypothetical protein